MPVYVCISRNPSDGSNAVRVCKKLADAQAFMREAYSMYKADHPDSAVQWAKEANGDRIWWDTVDDYSFKIQSVPFIEGGEA